MLPILLSVICFYSANIPSGVSGAECTDYLGTQCLDPAVSAVVCADKASAPQFCAKTCGLCPTTAKPEATTHRPTKVSTVLTTQKPTHPHVSTIWTTIGTKSSACYDDPSTHCDPKMATFVCGDAHFSQFCRKMCGLCGTTPQSTATSRVTTTPMPSTVKVTSSAPCMDDPSANCNDQSLIHLICNVPETAAQFCPKTCGICDGQATRMPATHPKTTVTSRRTTTTTTSTPKIMTSSASCMDDPNANCNDQTLIHLICKLPETATQFCPKTCGICCKSTIQTTMPSPTTTTTTPLVTTTHKLMTTTADTCVDNPEYHCTSPDVHQVVCLDKNVAAMVCPKTCGVCPTTQPTTQDSCIDDPMGRCSDPDVKSIVCLVPQTASLCPKTCNICGHQSKQHSGALSHSGSLFG